MEGRSRRDVLKLTPIAVATLAGCAGEEGGDGATPTATEEQTDSQPDQDTTQPDTPTETDSPTSTPESQTASVRIGEKVADDQMAMVVKSLTKKDSLGQYQNADEGNTYAIVRLEVKNTTKDKFANFSSFLQTQLQDSEGYSYNTSLSVSDSAFKGGELVPGEVARGDIVFEIPKDASGLTLLFDFSAFAFYAYQRVEVDLEAKANQIADLKQTLQVPIHGIGDSVEHDSIVVTVNSAEYKTSLGSFTNAPEGKEFAIVDVTTANETDEVVAFSSLLQMAVKDGTGLSHSYSLTATSQLTQNYSGGEVSPGQKTRGKVAYEVPKGVSPLYFTFEYSLISDGSKTFWQLR